VGSLHEAQPTPPRPRPSIIQAVDLIRSEALSLEEQFNQRYPRMVQEGRITALLSLSNRIQLLRHIATQLESI
jgi:hypothetical protein